MFNQLVLDMAISISHLAAYLRFDVVVAVFFCFDPRSRYVGKGAKFTSPTLFGRVDHCNHGYHITILHMGISKNRLYIE